MNKPLRLLVICPSWVGDVVMATPALGLLRRELPGAFIGAMVRPGLDELLAGTGIVDEFHVVRPSGVMGPKHAAAKVRPRRYDAALLLTNSFSTALTTRLAGIPRRIGYDRDLRGLLLTDRLVAPRRPDGSWAPVPAVEYYLRAAWEGLLGRRDPIPADQFMRLAVSEAEHAAAHRVLSQTAVGHLREEDRRYAILNPGGNNEAKRWPAERFALLGDHLATRHGLTILINGSPAEASLCCSIAERMKSGASVLPELGITLGSLKGVVAGAAVLVTNDTGPRHLAAAFGVPLVTLFGPTDHRWTTIPTRPGRPERILLADPTLPESELANDHPERCRIDRIEASEVIGAVDDVLARSRQEPLQ